MSDKNHGNGVGEPDMPEIPRNEDGSGTPAEDDASQEATRPDASAGSSGRTSDRSGDTTEPGAAIPEDTTPDATAPGGAARNDQARDEATQGVPVNHHDTEAPAEPAEASAPEDPDESAAATPGEPGPPSAGEREESGTTETAPGDAGPFETMAGGGQAAATSGGSGSDEDVVGEDVVGQHLQGEDLQDGDTTASDTTASGAAGSETLAGDEATRRDLVPPTTEAAGTDPDGTADPDAPTTDTPTTDTATTDTATTKAAGTDADGGADTGAGETGAGGGADADAQGADGHTDPVGWAKPQIIPPDDAAPGARPAAGAGQGGSAAAMAAPDGEKPGGRRSRRLKYARRAGYVVGVLLLLPIVGFLVVYLMTPVPSSTQPAARAEQSVFFYSDGKSVIARSGAFDRRPVELTAVPRHVRDAVISAENRSFYSDSGVSMRGSARAMWATLTGGSPQGGSTITQQMVRNYYSGLSQQRTVGRKLKEIMIALKVSREKNKGWILQQYLNTIYFGRDAYGIESAAQAYYNKDVKDLTAAEGAYLAAAIQVPTYAADLSVSGVRPYMQARWQYVVNGMVQMRTITAQEAAAMKFPVPRSQRQKSIYAGSKGYMVSQAKAELRRMGYTDNQINMGGLKVRTTFDKNLMDAARHAVEDNMPAGTPKKVMTGLVSINPANGEINAFYGGKNYVAQQFNNAFDAKVQAGSGFKPYVLAAALTDGLTLDTYVDGSSPQTFNGTPIQNDRNENFGDISLVTATEQSVNTAYINIGLKVGLDKVVAAAEKAGIPAAQLEPHKDAAVLPLGVADVSVEQQAAGYATFASEGVYHVPHVIRSVTERDGKVTTPSKTGKRAFSTTVARDATYAMQKVVDNGTGVNAALPDRNAAGKTGTTSSGKQIWFNGLIPQMAASVGIFRSDNKPLSIPGYSAYGGDLPAKIWRAYMVEADRDLAVKSFGAPSVYTGGYSRPTPAPVQPRPRPSVSRLPVPRPSTPSHVPTRRPTLPPSPPPTGPPTGAAPQNGGNGFPNSSG